MGMLKKLLNRLHHRHTWRSLRVEYRYMNYNTGNLVAVKRCQCRECGKLAYIHFEGKNILRILE